MSTFGQRIKKARLEAGLSQEALAEAMSKLSNTKKISRTTITQWESSATSGIGAVNLLHATKVLNITPDWLQFGLGDMRPSAETMHSGFDPHICFVPLLSYTHAVNTMEKESITNVGLDEQLAKIASSHSFALLIIDNSMTPTFIPGDVIVIDPSIKPSPGEFVVAKVKNYDHLIFRKYRQVYTNGSYKIELIALNEDWEKIIISSHSDGEIVGTLIEHRCRRRIHPHEETK